LEDTCDKHDNGLTYELDGQETTFLGNQDLHDVSFDNMEETIKLKENSDCQYIFHVFPSKDFEMKYETEWAWLYAVIVFCVLLLFLMVFGVYDIFIQRRQQHVLARAARSNAIVTSLFPSNVRDRILKDAEEQVNSNIAKKLGTTGKSQLKNYLEGGEGNRGQQGSKPIADLFPATTVMFGDIAGFTAWSSIREPCQVFSLLETLYNAFDDIAKRRRVYKVETVSFD
jgi:hypothetical protein